MVSAQNQTNGLVYWIFDFWTLSQPNTTCPGYNTGPFTGSTLSHCETTCQHNSGSALLFNTTTNTCYCFFSGLAGCTPATGGSIYTINFLSGGTITWGQIQNNTQCNNNNAFIAQAPQSNATACQSVCQSGGYNYYQYQTNTSCSCTVSYNPASDCSVSIGTSIYAKEYKTGSLNAVTSGVQTQSTATCLPSNTGGTGCSLQFQWLQTYVSVCIGFYDTVRLTPFVGCMNVVSGTTYALSDNNSTNLGVVSNGTIVTLSVQADGCMYYMANGTTTNYVLINAVQAGKLCGITASNLQTAYMILEAPGFGPAVSWVSAPGLYTPPTTTVSSSSSQIVSGVSNSVFYAIIAAVVLIICIGVAIGMCVQHTHNKSHSSPKHTPSKAHVAKNDTDVTYNKLGL